VKQLIVFKVRDTVADKENGGRKDRTEYYQALVPHPHDLSVVNGRYATEGDCISARISVYLGNRRFYYPNGVNNDMLEQTIRYAKRGDIEKARMELDMIEGHAGKMTPMQRAMVLDLKLLALVHDGKFQWLYKLDYHISDVEKQKSVEYEHRPAVGRVKTWEFDPSNHYIATELAADLKGLQRWNALRDVKIGFANVEDAPVLHQRVRDLSDGFAQIGDDLSEKIAAMSPEAETEVVSATTAVKQGALAEMNAVDEDDDDDDDYRHYVNNDEPVQIGPMRSA
jgi:hypothetical protein